MVARSRAALASADAEFRSAQIGGPSPTNEIVRSVAPDHAPSGVTWVQLIFVTWGGLLTVASVLRLVLG